MTTACDPNTFLTRFILLSGISSSARDPLMLPDMLDSKEFLLLKRAILRNFLLHFLYEYNPFWEWCGEALESVEYIHFYKSNTTHSAVE